VGAYAYNRGEDFSFLLINRDFEDDYTVQVQWPSSLDISPDAMIYTLWNDDFSSVETYIDSVLVTISPEMLITVPKHAMVIIAARGTDPEYTQLPHGYFDRIRADSIFVYTDGVREISRSYGMETIYGEAFPAEAFSREVAFEVIENTANAIVNHFISPSRMRIMGSGNCGQNGYVEVRVYSADNNAIGDTVRINITNQGSNCDVSTDSFSCDDYMLYYPNPVSDSFIVNKLIHENSTFELYDLGGRKVLQHPLNLGYAINIDDLLSGIYLIRVITPEGKELRGKLNKN
jgi:hypothetical protein